MIAALQAPKSWIVYILKCRDGSLYCGITTDLARRVAQHNAGKGAKYTRARRPVTTACFRGPFTRSRAAKIEYGIKRLDRATKLRALAKLAS